MFLSSCLDDWSLSGYTGCNVAALAPQLTKNNGFCCRWVIFVRTRCFLAWFVFVKVQLMKETLAACFFFPNRLNSPSDGACLFLLCVLSFTLNTVHSPASTDPCKVYQRSRTYWKARRPSFTSVHAPRVIYSHITVDSLVPAAHQWRGLCLCCLTKISPNSCCLLLTSSLKNSQTTTYLNAPLLTMVKWCTINISC